MRLERWVSIATIMEVLLIVVSVVVILRELDLSQDVAKAANATALTDQTLAFNQTLWQDGEVADIWYSRGNDLESETERRRYREMLTTWLIIHENVYYQFKDGLIGSEQYLGWNLDLETTIQQHNVALVSPDLSDFFSGSFGDHLEELREKRSIEAERK